MIRKVITSCNNFFEDIDLVVLNREEESGNELKKKLKIISSVVEGRMPEVEIVGVTNKLGMIRKTAHEYPLIFSGKFGLVKDKVILESSILGHFEPYFKQKIHFFFHEMMISKNQSELAEKYQLKPFTVPVWDIKRTVWEKNIELGSF